MAEQLHQTRRMKFLASSTCTAVQVERQRRALHREWQRLKSERRALEKAKKDWFDSTPRQAIDPARPFCFILDRMKRSWREMDRERDTTGRPVDWTVGSTDARKSWFSILDRVLADDNLVRVRHRYYDEPAVVMSESRFRQMEAR